MSNPASIKLAPVKRINGELTLPGSKSLSNRALLLAALASGKTELINLLRSDDTAQMIGALRQLGVVIVDKMADQLDDTAQTAAPTGSTIVTGNGGLFTPPSNRQFSLGNAGTAIRPLTAVLSLIPGEFTLDGDEAMRQRPIRHLAEALTQLGARIEYLGKPGCPPLRLEGGLVQGGRLDMAGDISSQYLTALLMALPLAAQPSHIRVVGEQVSKPYLELTLSIMGRFGGTASHEDYRQFHIPANQQYCSPGSLLIEGDASSASYFFGAAAIKGGQVRVHGLGENSIQGDYQFLDTIEQMGARVRRHASWVDVARGELRGIDVDLNHIPDAAMTIATMALFASGKTVIRNIYNWRVKETDRMHAMATELRKLGATVTTGDDYIEIEPPDVLKAATIDTYKDHRIAMSLSLAALGNQAITINDPDCTSKTFPDYFSVFESIAER